MSSAVEPERFITVSEMDLTVDGVTHGVSQTGGGEMRLDRPAVLPKGDAEYRFRLYSDGGELLSDEARTVRILEGSDEPRTTYRVETVRSAEAVA